MTEPTTTEFICEDCGIKVHAFGEHDGSPVCLNCRYIRAHPDLPEHIKATLRDQKLRDPPV
jgi:hypothetical protein